MLLDAPPGTAEHTVSDSREYFALHRVQARVNIRRELELLSQARATIPYSQFIELCAANGVPNAADANALAADLTGSGVAAHFPEHGEGLAQTLFLRPMEILKELDAATGGDPNDVASATTGRARIERFRARRAAVVHKLAPLNAQIVTWETSATGAANRRLLAGLGSYVGLQATFLLYTFELIDDSQGWPTIEEVLEPGWDVMEPLTYTVGSGLAWLSFGWFAFSGSSLGYQAIRHRHVAHVSVSLTQK